MAQYKITLIIDAPKLASVKKKLREQFGEAASARVSKVEHPKSRADRLAEAEGMASDAKSTCEDLRDEVQQWFDSLPENFQMGDKGTALEECARSIDEIIDALASIDFSSVSFPGMYG